MANAQSWLGSYNHKRISRRKLLAGTAAGAGAAALIACGGGGTTKETLTIDPSGVRTPGAVIYARDNWKLADETKQGVPGGIYRGVISEDLTSSWDPYTANVGVVEDFGDRGYDYLVGVNRGPGIQPGSPEYEESIGNLAVDWEVSSDGLNYTFEMRRGVKFHPIAPVNGREMTIDDWKASTDRYFQVGTNRSVILEILDKIEFPDARHMTMKLKEPYVVFTKRLTENDFGFKITPKEIATNPDLAATKMIGTAWLMVDKVQPSIGQEFKKWEGYWGGKPFIDRWHLPLIPETATRYAQFLAQNITSFSPSAREVFNARRDAPQALMIAGQVNPYDTPRGIFGKIDSTTAPWKDPRVRVALRKVLDYDAMLAFLSNQEAFRAQGIEIDIGFATHSPRVPSYWLDPRKNELGENSKNYFHSIADARKLVEAAGYPQGFDIDVWLLNGANLDQVTIMMDMYKKAENDSLIRANPVWKERQDYYDNLVYTANFKGIQATSSGAGGATDIDYVMFNNYHTRGRAAAFPDPKLDAMMEAQRRELDPEKRISIIKDWQRYVAQSWNIQPTRHSSSGFSFEWNWVHNSNYRTGPEGGGPSHLWWLDPDMPRRDG